MTHNVQTEIIYKDVPLVDGIILAPHSKREDIVGTIVKIDSWEVKVRVEDGALKIVTTDYAAVDGGIAVIHIHPRQDTMRVSTDYTIRTDAKTEVMMQ